MPCIGTIVPGISPKWRNNMGNPTIIKTCPRCGGSGVDPENKGLLGGELLCYQCKGDGVLRQTLECGFRQWVNTAASGGDIPNRTPLCVGKDCMHWDGEKQDCTFNVIGKVLAGRAYSEIPKRRYDLREHQE